MQTNALQNIAVTALNDLQSIDTKVLDVRNLTSITDTMIICTGRSTRHVKSIADHLIDQAKQKQVDYLRMEGDQDNEWVLVDMGDVVVHIMLPQVRTFYNLEALWEPIELQEQMTR